MSVMDWKMGILTVTAHQREVVMKMLDQAKIVMATDQQKLLKMAQDLLPNVATNLHLGGDHAIDFPDWQFGIRHQNLPP